MHLIRELLNFIRVKRAELTTRRQYRDLVDLEAMDEIAAELKAQREADAQKAHAARVEDDEGIDLMEKVLVDETITADEIPMIKTALKHFRHSRDLDHELSEMAR
jgi:hypothetical protein